MKLFILFSLLALAIAACGPGPNSDDSETDAQGVGQAEQGEADAAESESEIEVAESESEAEVVEEEAAPVVEEAPVDFDIFGEAGEDDYETTSSGLRYAFFEEGDGDMAEDGQIVTVHYTGFLVDGTKFDSSVDRGQPFTFLLGQGRVIQGWDEGIALMNVGDRGRLIIPSEIGYGPAGAGIIPPDSTLVFDVELLAVQAGPPESPMAVEEADYTATEAGVRWADLEVGDGQAVETGQTLAVSYHAWLSDGSLIDSSLLRGEPLNFLLGQEQLIPGWDAAMDGMQVGSVRQLIFPPELAGTGLPPGTSIIFEIELLDIR